MDFLDFSTWSAGTGSQTVNWNNNGTVTINNVTISSPWDGTLPQYYLETWDNSSATLPPELGGTPVYASELWFNGQTGSSISFDMNFSQAFTSSKTLFFDDIDLYSGSNSEAVTIQAFDINGNALDLSGWTSLTTDGKGTNDTYVYNVLSLSSDNLSLSILPNENTFGDNQYQPLMFLNPTLGQEVYRINVSSSSNFSNGSGSGWEVGAFAPVPVPEPSSGILIGSVAFVILLRRKRPRTPSEI